MQLFKRSGRDSQVKVGKYILGRVTIRIKAQIYKEKNWKTKIGTKSKGCKLKALMNIVDINPTIWIITLNISDLNAPIKRQRLLE